ncbi:hypothetical protein [Rhodococcus sp. H29-C3]|uniref:hypothetical protein n=1 Tax=Rhodococcus sp. H29-C3 TaxID=3046307 RepID=UPI0024BB27A0|nr:hypothetical protein [Rhodococcus sp. H29-C3]MDJ0363119.1 hypothetical protein [Rhodococcus sp. H29-C3]
MTIALAAALPPTTAHRSFTGLGMKLMSLDTQFSGTVLDIVEYRTTAAGGEQVTAILTEPGAWYSGSVPVVIDAADLQLLLAVQSIPRPEREIR